MSYIGSTPANKLVTSSDMEDGIVTTAKIANDAATADKIANAVNSAITANTSKTTNATHSGEVTGSGALTIAGNVVDEANLKVSNSPTNGYSLVARSGNTGGMTWEAPAGGGKIGQVIYGSTTSAYNSTSASYTDTGLTAAITPSATSSKVIVLFTQAGDFINPDSNGTSRTSYLATFRGSTEIAGQKQECKYGFGGYEVPISFSGSILDSPNTTNATTYKTMAKIDNASGQSLSFQIGTSRSQMILMEVLA